MSSIRWGAEIADVYDETYAAMFEPSVLGPMADVLAELAGSGAALEFAIGTGRVLRCLGDLRDRWAGWDRAPFSPGSQHQVAVFERLAG
jgi:hypothetical protein